MWVSNTHKVNSNTSDNAYTYQTFNLTDPDEFANFQNNGAFTNAGIKIIMVAAIQAAQILNISPNSAWVDVGDHIEVPADPTSNIILEYTGFNGTTPVKQGTIFRNTKLMNSGCGVVDISIGIPSGRTT
jgi:trehalose/maltose hydrolase-like predicted phosphorylase